MNVEINLAHVLAEVAAAFECYERALATNDIAVLDELFWHSRHAVRYGPGETLHGHAEIAAFRAARSPVGLARSLQRPVIIT